MLPTAISAKRALQCHIVANRLINEEVWELRNYSKKWQRLLKIEQLEFHQAEVKQHQELKRIHRPLLPDI